LWIDGARVVAATTCAQSCSSTADLLVSSAPRVAGVSPSCLPHDGHALRTCRTLVRMSP
jgi:hypothetical protein